MSRDHRDSTDEQSGDRPSRDANEAELSDHTPGTLPDTDCIPGSGRHLSLRHRLLLSRLGANGGESTDARVARDIAAYLADKPHDSVYPAEVGREYVRLHDSDLEELSRQGLIEYCEHTGTVRLTPLGRRGNKFYLTNWSGRNC